MNTVGGIKQVAAARTEHLRLGMLFLLAVLVLVPEHRPAVSMLHVNLGVIQLLKSGYVSIVGDPSTSCPSADTFDASDFRQALSWNGQNERALIYSGVVQWMNGDCSGALKNWREAANVAPVSNLTWLYLGKGEFVSGETSPAVTAFRNAEAEALLMRLGDRAASVQSRLEWYELAVRTEPTVLSVGKYAELLDYVGRKPEAVEVWEVFASQMAEDDPDHWWALAVTAGLRGHWAQAAELYHRGGALAGYPYSFLEREGVALQRAGDLDGAITTFRQAVQLYPEGVWTYWYAGHLERCRGRYAEAERWYQAAADIQPRHPLAHLYLGALALDRGQYDLAANHFATARTKQPDTYDEKRLCWFLERAMGVYDGDRVAWYISLGERFQEIGRVDEAILTYQHALELEPDNSEALAHLDALR